MPTKHHHWIKPSPVLHRHRIKLLSALHCHQIKPLSVSPPNGSCRCWSSPASGFACRQSSFLAALNRHAVRASTARPHRKRRYSLIVGPTPPSSLAANESSRRSSPGSGSYRRRSSLLAALNCLPFVPALHAIVIFRFVVHFRRSWCSLLLSLVSAASTIAAASRCCCRCRRDFRCCRDFCPFHVVTFSSAAPIIS